MLEQTFKNLLEKFDTPTEVTSKLWSEIVEQYSGKKKHYHTLKHLEELLQILNEVKSEIADWDVILFTLFYHDVIYNALKSDNEEQSAELAGKRMQQIGASPKMILNCKTQIIATKNHLVSTDSDTNYFLDADLSILGQDWEMYSEYSKNVRKEYSFYPDMVYNAGRRKVLKHFLSMDRIYKTPHFYEKFEVQAKLNIFKELRFL